MSPPGVIVVVSSKLLPKWFHNERDDAIVFSCLFCLKEIFFFFSLFFAKQNCIRKYGLMNMMIKHYFNGLILRAHTLSLSLCRSFHVQCLMERFNHPNSVFYTYL